MTKITISPLNFKYTKGKGRMATGRGHGSGIRSSIRAEEKRKLKSKEVKGK